MEERLYDLIFICRPDTPEADIDKVITTLETVATEKGGKIDSVHQWGRKRMAYRVQKLREGYYVYMVVRSSHGEVVKDTERRRPKWQTTPRWAIRKPPPSRGAHGSTATNRAGRTIGRSPPNSTRRSAP